MARPTDRSRAASGAHPSASYFAKALPAAEGGYTAQYGIPGLLPSRIKDSRGNMAIFDDPIEAELAAARAMISVLTSRSQTLRQGALDTYRKMTGAELASALARLDVTPTWLAYIVGTKPERVLKWLENPDEDVPHQVRLLLAIFEADPKMMDLAEKVTESVTTPKERK